jgi:hypothetical protein
MPDICMCASKDCPDRHKCFRAVAKPDRFQSYGDMYNATRKPCEYFWPIEKGVKDE